MHVETEVLISRKGKENQGLKIHEISRTTYDWELPYVERETNNENINSIFGYNI